MAPPGTWMTSPTKYNLTAIDRIGLPEGRERRQVKVLARKKGVGAALQNGQSHIDASDDITCVKDKTTGRRKVVRTHRRNERRGRF